MFCPKCDHVLSDDAEFCINCGEIFNQKLLLKMADFNKCPKCGAKLPEDSEFCIRCGELFNFKLIDDKILKKEEIIALYMGNTRLMKVKSFLFQYVYYFCKKMYFAGFLSFFLVVLTLFNLEAVAYFMGESISNGMAFSIYYIYVVFVTIFSIVVLVVMSIKSKHILFENALDYTLFTLSINSEKNYNDVKEMIIKDIKKKTKKGILLALIALLLNVLIVLFFF